MIPNNPYRGAKLPEIHPTFGEELNVLVNQITLLGYQVSGLLNVHLDKGDLSEEQLQALRLVAAYVGQANSEAFALSQAAK